MSVTSETHIIGAVGQPQSSFLKQFSNWCQTTLLALQYSRTVSALERMPDSVLDEIQVRREDIPAYANELIYKDG